MLLFFSSVPSLYFYCNLPPVVFNLACGRSALLCRHSITFPRLGRAPDVCLCFLEYRYVLGEFRAPHIDRLARLPLRTNCFYESQDLSTTQGQHRQQRQSSETRENSNAPALFRSRSASDQLRQVIECGDVKLRVHRDTVVFSGLRYEGKQYFGTLEVLREDGNDRATKRRGFANFAQDPIVTRPGFEAPIRTDEDKGTTRVDGCPDLGPELTTVRL
jgi:hypothetical protein